MLQGSSAFKDFKGMLIKGLGMFYHDHTVCPVREHTPRGNMSGFPCLHRDRGHLSHLNRAYDRKKGGQIF